jgi:AcrR family transcriptional regulator
MARLVPTPQALIDQLLRHLPHLPHAAPVRRDERPTTVDRILDAALEAFTEHGIRATTMTRVARGAGISREWLYKQFANRDALVVAVTQREAGRFIDGLAVRAFESDDLVGAVTDTFVYAVEFLRDHALLQRVLQTEPEVVAPRLLDGAEPIIGLAVRAGAGYLSALGDLSSSEATFVAETLVRLGMSVTLAPEATFDLHDDAELRRYAAALVPAVIAAARVARPPAPPKRRSKTTASNQR